MLIKFRDDIWICGAPLTILGAELGTRMTIVKLDDKGTLFVHSPIKLSPELKREIDRLGVVAYVVAPNKWHHLFIGDFKTAYPNAAFYCAPGLETKKANFKFDGVITSDQNFPWNSALDHKLVEGVPIFNEVVFFHRRSKTLIVTDLAFHICRSPSMLTRVLLKALGLYGKFGWAKFEKVLYVRNRISFKRSIENILEWDIAGIILTHGDVVESDGRARLRQAFA